VREDFLHQNSFDEIDTYTALQTPQRRLRLMMQFFYDGPRALDRNASFRDLVNVPARDGVSRLKFVPEAEVMERADRLTRELTEQIEAAIPQGVM
jgi:V/A-type H+-transporting ATPase subunit A